MLCSGCIYTGQPNVGSFQFLLTLCWTGMFDVSDTKDAGWSHAWVLQGPEGCAVVFLNMKDKLRYETGNTSLGTGHGVMEQACVVLQPPAAVGQYLDMFDSESDHPGDLSDDELVEVP